MTTAWTPYRRGMTRRAPGPRPAIATIVATLGVLEAFWGVDATHRQGPSWAQAASLRRHRRPARAPSRRPPVHASPRSSSSASSSSRPSAHPRGWASRSRPSSRPTPSGVRWTGPSGGGWCWSCCCGCGWVGLRPDEPTAAGPSAGLPSGSPLGHRAGSSAPSCARPRRRPSSAGSSREQRASRAVAEERNRIARELHDVIGHSVSVMTVQASAVRRRLRPDQTSNGRRSRPSSRSGGRRWREMRRMVGVLRQPRRRSPDREPPPGLAQLDRARRQVPVRRACPCDLEVAGDRRAGAGAGPDGVPAGPGGAHQHAAPRGDADAGARWRSTTPRPTRCELTVRDDGHPVRRRPRPAHGLLGMRERVAVYGGTLSARPRSTGGFELVATLPLAEPPVRAAPAA